VPLGTYTGWALRASPHANDGCEGSGQFIPFAKTRAERLAHGDPRLSLEERYGSVQGYSRQLQTAIDRLVRERLLLPTDAAAMVDRARADVIRRQLLPTIDPAPPR
jgi:hypothetical protein